MVMGKDLWVFMECSEHRLCRVGLELLGQGRLLADKVGEKLVAVILSDCAESLRTTALEYVADVVIAVENESFESYSTETYTQAICMLVEKYRPRALMLGASCIGRDLAPRVACRLNTGLTADCTSLDMDENGIVLWTRPAFGGNIMSTNKCPEASPQMGTVRPGVFPVPERIEGHTGEIIKETFELSPSHMATKIVNVKKVADALTANITEASIIVSGGRGMKNAENFRILEALAKTVGGCVGASRAAVDAGWISPVHQVGQTGRTVSPKIYIACGISGAMQHIVGMSSSDTIIAINSDPDAPIFNIADYAIVGDLFEIVPELTAEIRKLRG